MTLIEIGTSGKRDIGKTRLTTDEHGSKTDQHGSEKGFSPRRRGDAEKIDDRRKN